MSGYQGGSGQQDNDGRGRPQGQGQGQPPSQRRSRSPEGTGGRDVTAQSRHPDGLIPPSAGRTAMPWPPKFSGQEIAANLPLHEKIAKKRDEPLGNSINDIPDLFHALTPNSCTSSNISSENPLRGCDSGGMQGAEA